MAHKIRVVERAFVMKDGSLSKTKKTYAVIDRTRGRTVNVGEFTSKKDAEQAAADHRASVFTDHLSTHPHDRHFITKHARK